MFSGNSKIKNMVCISLMTALLCVLAPLSITLPASPVPFTPGNMIVCITIVLLGMKNGCLSVLLYLLLGFSGVPVFSNFTGGLGKILGPTGGYLLGYLLFALVLGFFAEHFTYRLNYLFLGAFLGMLLLYGFGTLWLSFQLDLTFYAALWVGVFPYIPMDILKITAALRLSTCLRKRLLSAGLL